MRITSRISTTNDRNSKEDTRRWSRNNNQSYGKRRSCSYSSTKLSSRSKTKTFKRDRENNSDKAPESITKFEETMFIVHPFRAKMFANFLTAISEFGPLRRKLMRASKESSFWLIADDYWKNLSGKFRKWWDTDLSKWINDFLDELEKNEKIDFSTNEFEEIKEALNSTFCINEASKEESWIKSKLLSVVWK